MTQIGILTTEEIVTKFAFSKPGFRVLNFDECALPVFKIVVRALTLERKKIQPIQEGCLQAIAAGLSDPPDIKEFLGLPERVITSTLAALLSNELLNVSHPTDADKASISLTIKGKNALQSAEIIRPEEHSFPIYFDGLLRRIVSLDRQRTFKPKEVTKNGWREIPYLPPNRPEISDLKIQHVQQLISSSNPKQKRDLLALKAIDSRELLFIPAVLLIYKSLVGHELQVSFVIDGRLADEQASVFVANEGLKILGIQSDIGKSSEDIIEELDLAEDTQENIFKAEELCHDLTVAYEQAALSRQALEEALNITEMDSANEILYRAEAKLRDIENTVKQMTQRWLYCADHPGLLQKALDESESRLMIISPWIRYNIVNENFCKKIEELLKRKVNIYIGYGLVDDRKDTKQPIDKIAMKLLEPLQKKYRNFYFKMLGDTHAKVLVSDNKFAITTSFNWLSFKGDPRRKFRDEQGFLASDPALVNAKFTELARRFI